MSPGFRQPVAAADTDDVVGRRLLQVLVFVLVLGSGFGWSVAKAVSLQPSSWHGPDVPESFVQPRTSVRATSPSLIGYLIPRDPSTMPVRRRLTLPELVAAWESYRPGTVSAVQAVNVYGRSKSAIAGVTVVPRPPVSVRYLPGLELHDDPLSRYRLSVNTSTRMVTVTVDDDSGIVFSIDYRDGANDPHRTGITPVFDGIRFESPIDKGRGSRTYPLVTPTWDAGKVTSTFISNEGGHVFVRFVTGPYSNLRSAGLDEGDTFLDATLEVDDGVVEMDLDGLYYIRPSSHGTEYSVRGRSGAEGAVVDEEVDAFTTYIADPKRIDVEDGAFGYYKIKTDAAWLQVQWNGYGSAFEFDFDHTYKDRLQLSVRSSIVFAPVVDRPSSPDPSDA